LFVYFKDDHEEDPQYMRKNLEGSLWIREAFMQAGFHTYSLSLKYLILLSLGVTLANCASICMQNMSNKKAETLQEWYEQTTYWYWSFLGLNSFSYFLYFL